MHIVPAVLAFRVLDDSRRVRRFASLAAVAAAVLDSPGEVSLRCDFYDHVGRLGLAVFDGDGERVPDHAIVHEMLEVRAARRAACRFCHRIGFRDGPVPDVHRRHGGSIYRSVATYNEIRASAGWEEDLCDVGYTRPVCRARRPPTSWDDILVRDERSWKSHRRAQWRGR
jgi:hypothetical protein